MRYQIRSYEVWCRTCEVEADSEDDALDAMDDGDTISDETEYVDTDNIVVERMKG